MGRRSDFSRSGYANSNNPVVEKRRSGGFGEAVSTTIKLLLIFSMVRITMLLTGITFIAIPGFDPTLRYAVTYLKQVTDRLERFWVKYR